jgi:hypothetical protein
MDAPCARRGRCAGRSVSMGNIHHRSRGAMRGKYFGSLTTPGPVYDHVLDFLRRIHGRKLREVMDAEIDISDVIQ